MKSIAFVAGRSGGHILPCLNLIPQYTTSEDTQITFFSTKLPLDAAIIEQDKRVTAHIRIPLAALPHRPWHAPLFLYQLIVSWIFGIAHFLHQRPSVLITTGGIVAIPVALAAFFLRIPLHVYVLDVQPGKALRFLMPLATKIFYCFAETKKYIRSKRASHAAYPTKYSAQDFQQSASTARLVLGLQPNKKTVTVLGGSQGSLFINNSIADWVTFSGARPDLQIIHQTGSGDTRAWHTIYPQQQIAAYVFDYRSNLSNVYAAADIIICRAGAGTLFEILAFGKKCIIIPLETALNTHQVDNAYALAAEYPEQCIVVRQKTITQNPAAFFALLDAQLGYATHHVISSLNQSEQHTI